MVSIVTAKNRAAIPKNEFMQPGVANNDPLECHVENGTVVDQSVSADFLNYRGSVKVGTGDIAADIRTARVGYMEKYR
jgi:hypothetical protein